MVMQSWYPKAKLGIFLHWGIYAVNSTAESWAFWLGDCTWDEYYAQADGFTASQYDPDAWARLFAEAGARYAVLTTKHHDGVALWDTKVAYPNGTTFSTVTSTPAARDLVTPYVEAMRRADIKAGLYFSHLDWHHPDYASLQLPESHQPGAVEGQEHNLYSFPPGGAENPDAWQRFLAFHRAQLGELCAYDPDILWFDGVWERTPEQWHMDEVAAFLGERAPHAVLNGRMGGHGDFSTQEQALLAKPPVGPWELCVTINDSWGFKAHDDNFKSVRQLVQLFVEVFAGGGNLLLDAGPMENGVIGENQAERLRGLGAWIRRNEEAVYETERGLGFGYFDGPTALSPDRKTLYLYLFGLPQEFVVVKGLTTPVARARVVGTGTTLDHQRVGGLHKAAGWEYVFVDHAAHAADMDPICTVIACDFDEPLELAPTDWAFD
ncbi:MAG: alpha-L-fucosidase [Propionibacteriaceae bacterium]